VPSSATARNAGREKQGEHRRRDGQEIASSSGTRWLVAFGLVKAVLSRTQLETNFDRIRDVFP
jgi:hypothetical protein